MWTTFAALAPVFLLILAGFALRRSASLDPAFWQGAEWLVYWVLFPALLFRTISGEDIAGLRVWPVSFAVLLALSLATGALLALRPLLGLSGSAFSSVLQGAIRPNTYVALAAAEALFGQAGLVVMGPVVFAAVVTVNLIAVVALVRFGDHGPVQPKLFSTSVRNPLVMACVAGFVAHHLDLELWSVLGATLDVLSRASLPLALLCVGAALQPDRLQAAGSWASLAHGIKLIGLPAITALCCRLVGVEGMTAAAAIMMNAAPISASSFVLARQLGGDAPLMAKLITASTLLAMATMPLVLVLLS